MSIKKMIGLTTGLVMVLLVAAPSHAQHRATRLGNPATRFAKPLKQPDDLRVLLRSEKMKADVAAILQEVGWKGNLEDLDRAAATADIEEVSVPVGTKIPYMAARKNGTPVVLRDVEWAGSAPFEAYAFEFTSNCQRYRLITPKACSNFWIGDLGKDTTSEACAPKAPDPVVSVTAGTQQACVTEPVPFTVNVKNYAADGPIVLTVNGKELAKGNLSNGTFKTTFPGAPSPGTYEVRAAAGDFTGAAKVEVKACVPTCGLTATPLPVKAGKPFTLDVSGSQVASGVKGGISSVKVEVIREGEVVDTVNMSAPNFVNNAFVIKKGGPHTVRAVVTDEAGQVSTNTCQADLDVVGGPPIFAGAYFGKERLIHDHDVDDSAAGIQNTVCAEHMGIAVGFQPKIGENAEAEFAVGYKINFQDGAHSSLYADGAVNWVPGRGFIGGGLTFWDIFEDDTRFLGLLVQGGFDLTPDGKWQIVGQARAPFDEFGDLENNYQLWGGIRFRPNSWK